MSLYGAEPEVSVVVNGKPVEMKESPMLVNHTTMVPFRPLFEGLGLEVSWDDVRRTVTGTRDGFTVELEIDSAIAKVNGAPKELAVAPRIFGGTTWVPLRFIGEATGNQVAWNGEQRLISITGPVYVRTIPSFGNGSFAPAGMMDELASKVVPAFRLYEKEGVLYHIWCEADDAESLLRVRLSAARADRWLAQAEEILTIPYYDDERRNRRPPIVFLDQGIVYDDSNGLKLVTYNETGDVITNDDFIEPPWEEGRIRTLHKVISGAKEGLLWGPESEKHIYFFDAMDRPISVKVPPAFSSFYTNLRSDMPILLDKSHTYATFQGNPFDPSILTRFDIRSGALEGTYAVTPETSETVGGQVVYANERIYLFYLTVTEERPALNVLVIDPVPMTVIGDYKHLQPDYGISTIVGDEIHVWTLSEATGEFKLSVFTDPT